MRVRSYCHYAALTGYGRAARDYLLALHQGEDVELEIACLGEGLRSPEPRYSALDPLVVPWDRVMGTPDVALYHANPRLLASFPWPETAPTKRVALTTWETDPLPWSYAEALDGFDGVIVPSKFCADLLDDRSIRNVRVIPHCFDEGFWPIHHRVRQFGQPFRFYSIGEWGERKNHLGVLRAYLHTFLKTDNVQLLLMINNADFDEIRSLIARSGIPDDLLPEIHVPVDCDLSEEQLVELHGEGDCFVSAARGEGFGLGMFEAAIMGKDIISTSLGGQLDFLRFYANWSAVPHLMTPCFGSETRQRVEQQEGQNVQVSRVSIPPGVDCKQRWAEPDLEAMAAAMRHLYERTETRGIDDLRTGRAALEAQFGYKTIGPQLSNLLRGIAWESPPYSTI